mgnify:FL=1
MTTYKFLQMFVLSYTGFVALFVIVMTAFEMRYGFKPEGKYRFFQMLNKLHGRITILLPFRILSVLFMFCWLALALPFVDLFIGTHYISSFTNVDGWTGIKTWFGTITDQGNAGAYYYGTVFVSILGVKGFWLVKRMADILGNDELAVSNFGRWGGTRDFRK